MGRKNLSKVIVQRICAINRINLEPNRRLYRENRERDAVSIKTAGKTVFTAEERDYVADPGHVLFLPKGSSYNHICTQKGESLLIDFESDLSSVLPQLKIIRLPSQAGIKNIFSGMERAWILKEPAYHFKCLAGLYRILAQLIDSDRLNRGGNAKYHIIKPALDYLEKNYNEPGLNIAGLARISGVSPVYFRKLFTGILHMPPMKYIQAVRIGKAKDMLVSDYYSVGSVAESTGFTGIYHFSKMFKKVTGLTPTEYARQNTGRGGHSG